MAVRATYVPEGIDIVIGPHSDPISASVLEHVYQNCGVGILECREHDNSPALAHLREPGDRRVHGAWVYVQKRRGRWVICHLPSGVGLNLESHTVQVGMTDQHHWQQDYWQRAADAVGYETGQEVTLQSGTRLDVFIVGPKATVGVEVQHSALSSRKVVNRTSKAAAAGIPLIWSADRKHPAWAYKVPHVETNELPDGCRPRGSWTVTAGPRWVVPARCTPANFDHCPQSRRGRFCRGWHPRFEPFRGLVVDDVAERAPAGQLVPLETNTRQGVILVSAAHYELWQNEFAIQFPPRPDRDKRSASRACSYDARQQVASQVPENCCRCGRLLMLRRVGRDTCQGCLTTEERLAEMWGLER